MRPLNLKIKGFTSFRDEQELDFRNLEVFAVTGPTGAGKSSLLDAMTYALYGEVERVGRECGQLVSHGLPRMAVTLDFEVDRREYRITRSTPARTGQSRVLLERKTDGEWRSYGEGADRVRDCNDYVKQLVGLDYTAFTRSVLLPQGKFAEFMAGKPEDRRAIMSDLLGLGLFKRMAQRAGKLAGDSESGARIKSDLLRSQYADVSQEALADARTVAQQAELRVARLERSLEALQQLNDTWRDEQQRAHELTVCATELRAWRARLAAAVSATGGIATELASADTALAEATERVAMAEQEAQGAAGERAEAERQWGAALTLAPALATARRLPADREQLAAQRGGIETLAARAPRLAAEIALARTTVEARALAHADAESALERARQHQTDLEHANMAAALVVTLRVGDPCPVCGDPLERLPEAPAAEVIAGAKRDTRNAQQAVSTAQQSVVAAERDVQRIERDIEEDERARVRLDQEISTLQAAVAAAEHEVVAALRGPLPDDPVSTLEQRIATLNRLETRDRSAAAAMVAAVQARTNLVHAVQLAAERLASQRTHLVDLGQGPVTRAASHVPVPEWPAIPGADAPAPELVEYGTHKLDVLDRFTADVERVAVAAAAAETSLLQRAQQALGDLVPLGPTLAATTEALAQASTKAVASRAAAAQRAEALSDALDKRLALEAEIVQHQAEATRFQTLATELRADRLIAFLQDEALRTLAEAGSRHLYELSGQRYELIVERDFYVVDKWSADEKRSVRTLSGGETFLASLSLALALSEQVRALSVTERARLDSLFLDEGFGTLDPDTLSVVVDAINQLSGGGRLVGVITHVADLAQTFERIEVVKSPRGSRLQHRQ